MNDLVPLAVGVAIAFTVRIFNSYKGDLPATLGAEAKRVFLPALLAFGGFLASGESWQDAAQHALLSAAVALGISGGKLRPPKAGAALLVVLATSGCAALPKVLGHAAQVGQYAAAAIDAAESAADRWFASHPSLDAQTAVQDALVKARAAIVSYDAAVAAGEDPSPAKLIAAYQALHAVLVEYGVGGLPPLGGAQGAESPGPLPLPSPAEFESTVR